MEQKKALIAMSGGVDSSVAAHLAMEAGYRCAGATMQLYMAENAACDPIRDAQNVTQRLDIPFHILDFRKEFQAEVMDAFAAAYEAGLTPNPCVTCNRYLKFDRFLKSAKDLGYDTIVTGHYAQVCSCPDSGRYFLQKSVDSGKDQTYFLYMLTQEQLAACYFPLGSLTKDQVRQIAAEKGFLNAQKRDSQDICFIPDGDYYAFLKRYTGKEYAPGNYLDRNGKVLGTHQGAVAYTIGQRKGLGIALGEPAYVCAKDMAANTVTLGSNAELFHRELFADNCNWMTLPELTEPIRVCAKVRSRMQEQPATVYPEANGAVRVVFDEPQRAITTGQAAVFYDGDRVVGGGTITAVGE